jgi:hypothetical protein
MKTMVCDEAMCNLPESDRCDPTEAPEGFYAMSLLSCRKDRGNLCRQCDWRKQCNDPATDLLAYGHRCKSVGVVATRDGKHYRRNDRCAVVFKRKEWLK